MSFADIQVSGSSVTPSTLRPGNTGSVSFTLTNTGAYGITGLTLTPTGYGFEFFSDKISVGTIGAAGSTPVNIQLRIPQNVESGVYNLMISAYWNEQTTSGGSGYKLIQIPVTVSKQTIFQVYSDPMTVGIGDDFDVIARIKNTGGKASNVVLTINSPYFINKDSSKTLLGVIGAGETVDVDVPISTNSSTPSGLYTIPVIISYQDDLGNIQQATTTLGTVQAVKGFVDFSVLSGTDVQASPGKKINMTLRIRNDGTLTAKSMRCSVSSTSSNFLPLGSSQRFLGEVKPGETVAVSYEVGISAGSSPGYYPVVLTIDYLNKQGEAQTSVSKNIGLEVVGTPKLSLITSTNPSPVSPGGKYSLSVQVSNIGTTDLKSLTVHVKGDSFTILENSPSTFIGNLKTDDYSQVSYQILVKKETQPGEYPVEVKMNFMDAYNNEQEVTQTSILQVVSPEIMALSGNGGGSGPDIWLLLFALLVVLIILYFAYKRFFKKNSNGKK
jgi:hypothetical protein